MAFFDFLKSAKHINKNSITNNIGKFTYLEFDGTNNYTGIINSSINKNIELLFPISGNEITNYQTGYFKKIENNWSSILKQLKNKNSQIDFENYKVVNIMIPDQENEFYDIDAEIVLKKKDFIISAILSDINVEEIIEI